MACDVAELLSCRKKLNNANDWVIHLEQLEEQGGDVKPANGPSVREDPINGSGPCLLV